MLANVQTAAVVGLSAVPVTVEVDVSDGLPGVTIVGLPDAAVRESRERIRSAIRRARRRLCPGRRFPSWWPKPWSMGGRPSG